MSATNYQNSSIDTKNTNHRFLIAKKLELRSQKLIHHQPTTKKELSVEREPQSPTNIFLDQPSNKEFKQWLGPRYDKGGELLAYTLIGKPDWFQSEKLQDTSQKNNQLKSMIRKVKKAECVVERLSVKMPQSLSSDKKVIFRKNEQIRTKTQLLDELVTIKERIQANKLKDDEQLECLPENPKRIFNKQQNTLQKHEEQLNVWEQFVSKCSEQLERDPLLCQMNRAENYRAKYELAQNFDILKSDHERFGPNIWYMTLRKMNDKFIKDSISQNKIITEKKEEDNIMIQQQQQLPSVFHSSSLGGLKNSLEYIRKPLRNNQSLSVFNHSIQSNHSRKGSLTFLNSLQNSQSIPFYSFRSDKYLMERMSQCKKALNKEHMIQFDEANEIDQLSIQGQSQLKRETQQLQENGATLYTKYVEHPNGIQVQEEEILAEDQSKVNQIKLPQITQMNRQRKLLNSKNESISNIPYLIE